MTEPHMECDKCAEHLAFEERMKMLDKVPGILSWMNALKGAVAVIIFLFPIMYAQQTAERAEMNMRLKDHETQISHKQDKISEQVTAIGKDTEAIRSNVAVLVKSVDLKNVETEKAINELKMYRPR
jgi:uncharacterized membrane protein